jgi:hypothetical protein
MESKSFTLGVAFSGGHAAITADDEEEDGAD